MFIIGNKIDLKEKREINEEEGRNLAKKNEMDFLELSSINKESAHKSMLFIIKKMLNLSDYFSSKIMMDSKSINKKENEIKKKKMRKLKKKTFAAVLFKKLFIGEFKIKIN